MGGNPLSYTDPLGLAGVLPGPIPLPIPGFPGTSGLPGKPKDDGSFGGLFPPGTMSSSSGASSSSSSASEECEQKCDDNLSRDYAYCKALGGMYNDYRTRKVCEERAFSKYVLCRKQCKEKCK